VGVCGVEFMVWAGCRGRTRRHCCVLCRDWAWLRCRGRLCRRWFGVCACTGERPPAHGVGAWRAGCGGCGDVSVELWACSVLLVQKKNSLSVVGRWANAGARRVQWRLQAGNAGGKRRVRGRGQAANERRLGPPGCFSARPPHVTRDGARSSSSSPYVMYGHGRRGRCLPCSSLLPTPPVFAVCGPGAPLSLTVRPSFLYAPPCNRIIPSLGHHLLRSIRCAPSPSVSVFAAPRLVCGLRFTVYGLRSTIPISPCLTPAPISHGLAR
jgi:hypothetical protein